MQDDNNLQEEEAALASHIKASLYYLANKTLFPKQTQSAIPARGVRPAL
jgi:hypothetical protein